MSFQFIHCGDLHLGCNPNRLEERFEDFFLAFSKVIAYAIKHEIKLLLISGDLFHLKAINSKTLQRTIELLQLAKDHQIDVVAIEGNHDKAFYVDEDSWLDFLNQQGYLKLLMSGMVEGQVEIKPYENKKGAILETKEYRVIGLGYFGGTTQKYIREVAKRIEKKNKFTILMLHAAIGRLGGQDLGDIEEEDVLDLKDVVDYVALGHIHNRYESGGFCYNPGALETIRIRDGRTMDKKGFYHVTVDGKKYQADFIQSEARPIVFISLSADSFRTPSEFETYLKNYEYEVQTGNMMEINLYGKVDYNPFLINFNEIVETIKEKYGVLHIEINNKINLQVRENQEFEEVDMEKVVLQLVEDEIQINYPELEGKEELAKRMIEVSDLLNDDVDLESIVKQMRKWDVKL